MSSDEPVLRQTGFTPRTGLLVWQCMNPCLHQPHDWIVHTQNGPRGPVHCRGKQATGA